MLTDADVGRFSSKWQSVIPDSFNSAAGASPTTILQRDTAGINWGVLRSGR